MASKIAGLAENSFQFIFSWFAFNNSIASGFGFDDKNPHFIFSGSAFNNSIALGLVDNSSQSIFLLFF